MSGRSKLYALDVSDDLSRPGQISRANLEEKRGRKNLKKYFVAPICAHVIQVCTLKSN